MSEHTHTHIGPDGVEYTHSHEHKHSHTQTKAVLNRLSRAIGHLESVRKMVEDGRDCTEVLVQLAAVRQSAEFSAIAALSSAEKQESMSVSTAPGATAFTRMPEGPSSLARPLTKAMIAPLVAE